MTQTQQQAITEALRQALERLIPFVEAYRIGPGSNEREYEFVGRELNASRAALAALESASPVEPATAATGYPMAWGDGSGEATERPAVAPAEGKGGGTHGTLTVEPAPASAVEAGAPAEYAGARCTCETCEWLRTEGVPTPCERLADEYRRRPAGDAEPPACPARKAISELLKCPDGRSLAWPEIDEICRAALSAPCPTAELRDEIEQHNLWRAEAYRQIAERDAEIERLKIEAMGSTQRYQRMCADHAEVFERAERAIAESAVLRSQVQEKDAEIARLQQTDSQRQDDCYASGARDAEEAAEASLAELKQDARAYYDATEAYILRLFDAAYTGHGDVREGARREIDYLHLRAKKESAAEALCERLREAVSR